MNSNKIQHSETSLKNSAITAGIGLLVMAAIAPIANFVILQGLIDPADAEKTVSNIASSSGLFRLGIALFMIVALLDIIVAWALYVFLIPINRYVSLLTAWLRLVYAAILVVALFHLLNVLHLLHGTGFQTGLSTGQIHAEAMLSLNQFTHGWELGLIIFGFHLLFLGYLILKGGYMRNVLGILIILAALGYLIDGFGKLMSSDYTLTISMFTFIGELILIFWLLIKGRKIEA